jgi:hypothetical protein
MRNLTARGYQLQGLKECTRFETEGRSAFLHLQSYGAGRGEQQTSFFPIAGWQSVGSDGAAKIIRLK